MKKRFSPEQIIGILKEGQGGRTAREVCARHNVSEQTFYRWKRVYGDMEVNEVRKMKVLAEENSRLKRLVADLAVQVQILQEVNSKKW